MTITRTSVFTGEVHSIDLPVTEDQMLAYYQGALLQNAFPNLSPEEREFIKSGVTASEWNNIFGAEAEE